MTHEANLTDHTNGEYDSEVSVEKNFSLNENEPEGQMMESLSHGERARRRKEMADYVRSLNGAQGSFERAARKFKVSLPTIRTACREFGLKVPRQKKKEGQNVKTVQTTIDIITGLLNGWNSKEIAATCNTTRQWVHQVKAFAEESGLFEAAKKATK